VQISGTGSDIALTAIGGLLLVFVIYLVGTYAFAHLHPDLAALGDTEWLKWSKDQLTAKDKGIVIDQRPIMGKGDDA
jgi:hypothetical protein